MTFRTTLLLLVALSALVVPPTTGTEMHTAKYLAMGVPSIISTAFLERDIDEDGEPETPAIGGRLFTLSRSYTHAIGIVTDDLYGSDAPIDVCLKEDTFSHATECSGVQCGAVYVTAEPSRQLIVNVFLIHLTDDLVVCAGSVGVLQGTAF